jgi:O-antigen ligase
MQSLNVMISVVEGLIVFIAGLIPVVLLGGLIGVPIYRVVRRRVKQAKQSDE